MSRPIAHIIATTLSGAYTRTIWVSAAGVVKLSDTANGPSGATGDAAIRLEVTNQAGRTLTKTSLGVNMPVEILYAVDGTLYTAADNGNVFRFVQGYRGVGGTDKHYYDGPQNGATGSDSPAIVTAVENQIETDYATALSRHRRLVIDLTGFSRGSVIIATVAQDLTRVALTNTSVDIGTGAQSISVHWVGLFDAVSQMGANAPHTAWATTFSANIPIGSRAHLIHTQSGPLQSAVYITVMTFQPTTDFNLPGGRRSSHNDIGTNAGALQWMIGRARAAKVPR